jgi:hypothetical protein
LDPAQLAAGVVRRTKRGYLEGELREMRSAFAEAVREEVPDKLLDKRACHVLGGMKSHSKRWRYPFIMEREDVERLVRLPCFYCGHVTPGGGGVDRVDSRVGYQPDNCVPCCAECNVVMGDVPPEAKAVLQPALATLRECGYFGWVATSKRKIVNEVMPTVHGLKRGQLERVVAKVVGRVNAERERLGVADLEEWHPAKGTSPYRQPFPRFGPRPEPGPARRLPKLAYDNPTPPDSYPPVARLRRRGAS